MTVLPPVCPICGASMLRKLAQRGPRAGLEFWGCERFPDCAGLINIDATVDGSPVSVATRASAPAAYAQREHLKEVARGRLKRRAALPLMVGAGMFGMAIAYVSLQPIGTIGATAGSLAVGLILMFLMFRLPFDSLVWTKGVEGERKTAGFIEPLLDEGYVALFNRLVPGLSGDVDCLVIGPTGVFVVETKNWTGKLEVRGDRLFAGDSERTWALEQLYKESIAAQIALGAELNRLKLTVTPVLCAAGGLSSSRRSTVGVYVTNGSDLARFIRAQPIEIDQAGVRRLARLAERQLRQQYVWEVEQEGLRHADRYRNRP